MRFVALVFYLRYEEEKKPLGGCDQDWLCPLFSYFGGVENVLMYRNMYRYARTSILWIGYTSVQQFKVSMINIPSMLHFLRTKTSVFFLATIEVEYIWKTEVLLLVK